MPKRKNLPKVLPASDLGNRAMGLSILCRLERVKERYVVFTGQGYIDLLAPLGLRSYLTRDAI